jgi:cytochrome c553
MTLVSTRLAAAGNVLAGIGLGLLIGTTAWAQAPAAPKANLAAGKARVEAACAACHGANGISISDTIPNLAGQRSAYLEAQLRALKAGTRRNAVMNAIAAQLGPEDIANVAAYFNSLQPAGTAARSDPFAALVRTNVTFPEGYKSTFKMYQTVNRPDINQVRYLWANPIAWEAARQGKPLPHGSVLLLEQHAAKLEGGKPVTGADGFFVSDRLVAYALMAQGPGWGNDIPEILRNGDWNYAVFTPDMKLRPGVSTGECLACHKPLDKANYLFSNDPLFAASKR